MKFKTLIIIFLTVAIRIMAQLNQAAVENTLRTQLEKAQDDLKQYRHLYREECKNNRETLINLNEIRQEFTVVKAEKLELEENIKILQEHVNSLKVPKGYKKYHQLKSPTAKARRKAQLKNLFKSSNDSFARN